MIDITFDFRTDSKGDPDTYSSTLAKYHQVLWSKQLPNGERMELKRSKDTPYVFTWKDFELSSDTIIIEMVDSKSKKLMDQVRQSIDDFDSFYEHILHRSYSIGGVIIFPRHRNSMNQMRGMNSIIRDRWDLTLECIRRYYAGEKSPLSKVIESDKSFYDLFVDFKGYVDFFLLQDCVSDDYSRVDIWCGDASFEKSGLPDSVDEYLTFIRREHEFLDKRNARIQKYCIENNLFADEDTREPKWLKSFIDKQKWIFAKTYANKAPHEYVVRGKVEGTDEEFMSVVNFIQEKGITMCFWNHPNKYIFVDDHQYWVMRDGEDDPTTILNRCKIDEYKYTVAWKGKRGEKE